MALFHFSLMQRFKSIFNINECNMNNGWNRCFQFSRATLLTTFFFFLIKKNAAVRCK